MAGQTGNGGWNGPFQGTIDKIFGRGDQKGNGLRLAGSGLRLAGHRGRGTSDKGSNWDDPQKNLKKKMETQVPNDPLKEEVHQKKLMSSSSTMWGL